MTSFLKRMPQGIPGDSSRQSASTIESQALNVALPFPGYGLPGKIVAGKFVPVAAAGDGAKVYGLLVRPFPVTGANASDPLGTSVPAVTTGPGNIMRRGYMTVKSNAGVAALGGVVYVRVATPTGPQPIGGIEAAADGANTEVIPGATFMSAADSAGNVEIGYNI